MLFENTNIGSTLADINPISLLPRDNLDKAIRAKCERNGGAEAFDNLDVRKIEIHCLEILR